ncbi:hypothetical protein KIN20_015692 [Parelaphostrongylus tenuis]|uniref:Uncharacterized protein n=1 Tax=Parelaphostrongylus tenuis TaxID=148309 RepID=A0AAD5QP80_PARTN|nr:hypothetical protein KIN20_015692 [Parelaphostrongylus tenuis]
MYNSTPVDHLRSRKRDSDTAASGEQVQEVAEISEPNKATNIEQAKNVKLEDKFPRFIAAPATANCPPHSAPISTFCTGLHT